MVRTECQRIDNGRDGEEAHCKRPEFPARAGLEELRLREVIVLCIMAVALEFVLNRFDFVGLEEGHACFVDFVGEIDDEQAAKNSEEHCH